MHLFWEVSNFTKMGQHQFRCSQDLAQLYKAFIARETET